MKSWLRILRHSAFTVMVAACVALVVLNVQAWRGGLVDEPAGRHAAAPPGERGQAPVTPGEDPASSRSSSGSPAARPASGPASAVSPAAEASNPTGASSPGAATLAGEPAGAEATVSITRTDGPCWVLVRAGSPGGEVLYEGMLESGQTLTFSRNRVWLRLGAVQNVRVALNGDPVQSVTGGGTIDLVATAAGVRPVAA